MDQMMSNYLRFPRHEFFSVVIAAALCLSACDSTPASLKRPNMTALSPRLQSLFQETKTLCFSHFTVEIPATATVVFGPAEVEAPITYYPGQALKVTHMVAEQLIEIEKDRKFLSNEDVVKLPMFGKTIDGAVPGQKLVFGSKNQVGYSVSSYIPVGGSLFVQRLNGVYPDDDAFKTFNTVATQLRVRDAGEIPSEAGTCIDGGFLPLPLKFEKVTLGVRLKEFPDVHFSVEVHKNQDRLPESTDLESRLKGAEEDGGNWYSRITFFRRGPRQLGDWKGTEALALKPAQENVKESHEFHFISLGAPNAPLQPQLDVQLDTGASGYHMGAVKPSLSNEEAVALWDKLTNSIRVRPLGGNKKSSAESHKAPPASLVNTGGICPQSGWWQCVEGESIEGGRRRHFAAGEAMPHAVLLGEPNLWQKLTGNQPRHTRATVWKLVGYDTESAAPMPIADESSPLAAITPVSPLPEVDAKKAAPPSTS
jgi:hypothetical protein